ncbi:ABC transporter substrate-binding protein [Sphingomonas profundi]|uniref:ABC transporter substrate-binding protein n=1 Tax=Alterirhizorhabdus profundi TaxID=2681549 RepID=UPI0012E768D9|nr:ABC transporter substrate-binding protein [Sphingomonas profundi]
MAAERERSERERDWLADRRALLRLLGSTLSLSAASSLFPPMASAARAKRQPVALLVPLTGPSAALGLSMQRATMLVQSADPPLAIDTADGAAAAARTAAKRGARLILGPLFAADVRPVVAAVAGRVPVLAFSNDAALRESGAFLLGLTAAQTTSAILQYARKRGIRRVAMPAATDDQGRQALAAAQALQASLGIEIVTLAGAVPADGAVAADAVLVPQGGDALVRAAAALGQGQGQGQGQGPGGVQLLGLAANDAAPAAIAGAWIAAPDPAAFGGFAEAFASAHGGTPGLIAALARDGMAIAETLRAAGPIDRAAILAQPRFEGVAGALRFRSDGSAARDLAILVAGRDGYEVVDRLTGA